MIILNKICSDAIFYIDTGCGIGYLKKELGNELAVDAIEQLLKYDIIDIDNDYITVKWNQRNIRYNKKHKCYVCE